MFEHACSEGGASVTDNGDAELKRLSANRSSIAERRRMYESRSISGNAEEKPPQSPLPLL